MLINDDLVQIVDKYFNVRYTHSDNLLLKTTCFFKIKIIYLCEINLHNQFHVRLNLSRMFFFFFAKCRTYTL